MTEVTGAGTLVVVLLVSEKELEEISTYRRLLKKITKVCSTTHKNTVYMLTYRKTSKTEGIKS